MNNLQVNKRYEGDVAMYNLQCRPRHLEIDENQTCEPNGAASDPVIGVQGLGLRV